MTPWWDRVFPSGRDLTEIDAERYILIVRNWGRRQYKALKELEDSYKCGFGCGELGYPEVYMGNGALYCGSCMDEKK